MEPLRHGADVYKRGCRRRRQSKRTIVEGHVSAVSWWASADDARVKTACALVPPKPKDDTPQRAYIEPEHICISVGIRLGKPSTSKCGLRRRACKLKANGQLLPKYRYTIHFNTPPIPAAPSVCPKCVFAVTKIRGGLSGEQPMHCRSAFISIGSPSAVPVP